jgi:hypothetical protein
MTRSLEIHHIYVGHGDATVVAIKDDQSGNYLYKLLIDASTSSGLGYLLDYFANNFANSDFDLVIASHYHDDHLNGLAIGLGQGIHAESVLDVGGYDLTNIAPGTGTAVPNANPPVLPNPPYLPTGTALFDRYLEGVKYSALPDRMNPIQRYAQNYPANFGVAIPLGTINGVNITLKCHAANGYVQGTAARNTGGNPNNPNNYCLAFILEYGAFRYFTGGDLGGSGGNYYDHESLLANYLQGNYPQNGHVCAFKSNHHGSDHSNNTNFLNVLRPAVCITSVGLNGAHRLPGGNFLTRLNATTTPNTNQGFYFTNLGDFGAGSNRLTQANGLFSARANTTYNPGGGTTFMIRVGQHANNSTQSIFSVYRILDEQWVANGTFNCH